MNKRLPFFTFDKSKYMHPLAASIIAGGLFALLSVLLYLPFVFESGNRIITWTLVSDAESEQLKVPFFFRTKGVSTLEFTAPVGELNGVSLCLSGADINAISASLNGELIYELGDQKSPTGNLWNSMIVIRLPDSDSPTNEISLSLSGNYFISIIRPPTIEKDSRAIGISTIHRILHHDFIILFMGAALLTGLLSIGSGVLGARRHVEDILLGIACIIIITYAWDYTFRESTGSLFVYNLVKRITLSCAYLGGYLYLASIDYHCNKSLRISRWVFIPSFISFMAPLVVPSLEIFFYIIGALNIIMIIQLLIIVFMVFKTKIYYPLFIIPIFLLIFSMIQSTYCVILRPGLPVVLPYAIVLSITLFGVQFARDRKEIVEERDRLKRDYNKDPLTQAFNRHVLSDMHLEGFFSAIFLDFDNFKYYNDEYGHDRGDELLKEFVSLAKGLLRQEDVLIRFGGDEFLILFRDANEVEATAIMERIRTKFIRWIDDEKIDLSYGVSHLRQKGGLNLISLDEKMYEMKEVHKSFSNPD